MTLTGTEQFQIRGYRQPARIKRLADMTTDEVLCAANDRDPSDPIRTALYAWQHRQRQRPDHSAGPPRS